MPELSGDAGYLHQAPKDTCRPLWGNISEGGAAAVKWHPTRKTNQHEWAKAVREGKLTDAIRKLNPRAKRPYNFLSDNESCLRAKENLAAYRVNGIVAWSWPPTSADPNPVELFWGWMRKKLRRMDLADLRNKEKVLGKFAHQPRAKRSPKRAAAREPRAATPTASERRAKKRQTAEAQQVARECVRRHVASIIAHIVLRRVRGPIMFKSNSIRTQSHRKANILRQ